MKRKHSDDRVDEMLARHLHRAPPDFDFDRWAEKFPEEARLASAGFAPPATDRRVQFAQIWRCIMTSRYTKCASVAAVLLVGVSFLFPGRNGIVPESIVWADVQKALEEKQYARVTGTRNCYFGDDQTPTYKLTVEKLFSRSYGYADRTYMEDGRLIIEFIFHLPSSTVTVLFPTVKKYYRMEIPAEYRDRIQRMKPEGFFEWLWASGDYRQLEPRRVQGIEAAGFEIRDLIDRLRDGMGISSQLVDFFFSVRSLNARIWVNPKTRLPIQVEADGELNPCLITAYREMRLHEIDDRMDLDVELDESLFNPEIPEDYEQLAVPGAVKAGAALSITGLACVPFLLITRRRRARRRRVGSHPTLLSTAM
jgi:hypothetical protein